MPSEAFPELMDGESHWTGRNEMKLLQRSTTDDRLLQIYAVIRR